MIYTTIMNYPHYVFNVSFLLLSNIRATLMPTPYIIISAPLLAWLRYYERKESLQFRFLWKTFSARWPQTYSFGMRGPERLYCTCLRKIQRLASLEICFDCNVAPQKAVRSAIGETLLVSFIEVGNEMNASPKSKQFDEVAESISSSTFQLRQNKYVGVIRRTRKKANNRLALILFPH